MKEITAQSLREIIKMGVVFILMSIAIVWMNSRLEKLESRLENCEKGRLQDARELILKEM